MLRHEVEHEDMPLGSRCVVCGAIGPSPEEAEHFNGLRSDDE